MLCERRWESQRKTGRGSRGNGEFLRVYRGTIGLISARSPALSPSGGLIGRAGGSFGIDPDADIGRKPRHAAVGELLVAEGDDGADRRRCFALGVGEAGAHGELRPVGQLHEQRAEPALVPPGTLEVVRAPAPRRRGSS